MYYYYYSNKPDIKKILSNVYDYNGNKLNILSSNSASRLSFILYFLKKNNIEVNIDKIQYICDRIKLYKNIKLLDDHTDICQEINTVRNRTIKQILPTISIISFMIYFDLKKFDFIKKYSKLCILLFIAIIFFLFMYYYSYNYMKDELKYNDEIINYIKNIKSLNNINLYIPKLDNLHQESSLYKTMFSNIDIDELKNYSCCNLLPEAINKLYKYKKEETELKLIGSYISDKEDNINKEKNKVDDNINKEEDNINKVENKEENKEEDNINKEEDNINKEENKVDDNINKEEDNINKVENKEENKVDDNINKEEDNINKEEDNINKEEDNINKEEDKVDDIIEKKIIKPTNKKQNKNNKQNNKKEINTKQEPIIKKRGRPAKTIFN